MKNQLYALVILLLGLSAAACQQQPALPTSLPAVRLRAMPAQPMQPTPPPAARLSTTLAPQAQTLLQRVDLSDLWLNRATYPPVMEGLYGPAMRPISFVFTLVWQATTPGVFYVRGKNRLNGRVVPFEGMLQVTRLVPLPAYAPAPAADSAVAYTAVTRFFLKEEASAPGAGVFEGTAYLDWYITKQGKTGLAQCFLRDEKYPAKGSGLLFRGKWQGYRTSAENQVMWSSNIRHVAAVKNDGLPVGHRVWP